MEGQGQGSLIPESKSGMINDISGLCRVVLFKYSIDETPFKNTLFPEVRKCDRRVENNLLPKGVNSCILERCFRHTFKWSKLSEFFIFINI